MSRFLAVLAAVICLVPSLRAADEPTAPARPPRIGYVDIVRVLKEYKLADKYKTEATEKHLKAMRRSQKAADDLSRLKADIDKLAMGTPERLDLQRRFDSIYTETDEYMQTEEQELNAMMAAGLRQVYGDMTAVVNAVAKEGAYDLVLQDQNSPVDGKGRKEVLGQVTGRVVLYAKDGYDLTDTVIKRLNAAYDEKMNAAAVKDTAAPAPKTDEKRTK